MAGTSTPPSTDSFLQKPTLNSWKEIALYLDRGVRTVQRWEQALHLPVYRIGKSERGPVFAYRREIDSWLEACARNPEYSAELAAKTPPELNRIRSLKHDPIIWDQVRVSTESIRSGTERLSSLVENLRNLMQQDRSPALETRALLEAD